jgi:transcriptional regulator with XRE-family HTH domain
MKYSRYLRRYRKLNNLKQQNVAQRIGLQDGSLISRWENGFSLPDLENAFKLPMVYGVTVDVLFAELRRSVQPLGPSHGRSPVNGYDKIQTTAVQSRQRQREAA